jgi:integrase
MATNLRSGIISEHRPTRGRISATLGGSRRCEVPNLWRPVTAGAYAPALMGATARRGWGEGSVYRDGNGWVATVELGRDPLTGKRQRVKVRAKTKREVVRQVQEAQRRAPGVATSGGSVQLGEFLESWLSSVIAHRVDSPNTLANYTQLVRLHIVPSLGRIPLSKLTPEMVDRFLCAKATTYSTSSVGRMRSVLADALTHAERRGILARNAARLAVMPKCQPTAPRASLTADQARQLLAAADGERLGALVATGLMLGLRPGELGGLLWVDLDLQAEPPTLSITGSMKKQPDGSVLRGGVKKSTAGLRTIGLPPDLVMRLKAHRALQAEERLRAGDTWEDHGLIFASEVGTPLDPSNVRRTFSRISKRAGLGANFPYALRHSAASLLIDGGASIEEVADLFGDDPRTLYRHYRHRTRPVAEAASRMTSILAPPVEA